MSLILVLVQMKEMALLLKKFTELKDQGCCIPISGAINHRPNDGFIVLQWDRTVPLDFRQRLDDDPNIIDHIGLNVGTQQSFIVQAAW